MFITPEEMETIPGKIPITYDGVTNWIYLSNDTMKCFICKKEGHQAKNFPYDKDTAVDVTNVILNQKQQIQQNPKANLSINISSNSAINDKFSMPPLSFISDDNSINQTKTLQSKRALSDSNSTISTKSLANTPTTTTTDEAKFRQEIQHKATKKAKVDSEKSKTLFIPEIEREMLKNKNKYPLTYLQLINVLEKALSNSNPKVIVNKFTDNPMDIINTLIQLRPLLIPRGLKNRFSRLIKKLCQQECTGSEISQDSYTSDSSMDLEEI